MSRIFTYFKTLPEREATKFLIIFYFVGIAGFLIPYTRGVFELLISVSILINLFLLFLFHKPINLKQIVFFLAIMLFTFIIEAIGVNTGVLFGEYVYGNSLPGKLFGTPLLIGANWLLLSYGAVSFIRTIPVLRKVLPVLVGILMTFFDFIMEPVAMKTDMWTWSFNSIPVNNYVMWFTVSVILAAAFELFKIETVNKIATRIFFFQLIFFIVLNLFLP